MTSSNEFRVGQVVRHKASKQLAVIVEAQIACTKHQLHLKGAPYDCELEFTGWYTININFENGPLDVPESILESIED